MNEGVLAIFRKEGKEGLKGGKREFSLIFFFVINLGDKQLC